MRPLYTSLSGDSFRLLHFLDDIGLVCSMHAYPRDKVPAYIALSYTWGRAPFQKGRSPSLMYSISLNGEIFHVQQNLYDAFRHLGKHVRTRDRAFWVDAICINQGHMRERSKQVPKMRAIDEYADGVFAWLGVPFDDQEIRLGVALMQDLNDYLHKGLQDNNGDIDAVLRDVSTSHPGFPNKEGSPVWTGWDGIAEMLNQSYWHRVWIYQEATTPGEIRFFCGDHSFNDILLSATVSLGITFSRVPGFPVRFIEACRPGGSAGDI